MIFYPFYIVDYAHDTSHLTLEEDAVYRRLMDYYYETESPIPSEPKKTQQVIRRLRLQNHQDAVEQVLSEFFYEKDGAWHHERIDAELIIYKSKAEQSRINGKKGGRPKKRKETAEETLNETQTKPGKTQQVIPGNPWVTQQEPSPNPDQTQTKAINDLGFNDLKNLNTKTLSLDEPNEVEPVKKTSPHKKPSKPTYPPEFESFWKIASAEYKRSGDAPGNKIQALESWKKLKPDQDEITAMVQALRTQATIREDARKAGQRVDPFKHVCRWLKMRGWEDVVTPRIANHGFPHSFQAAQPVRRSRHEFVQ